MMTPARNTDVTEALSAATKSVRADDYEGAIVHLKQALDAEPTNEVALGMLGSVYAQLNMSERAAEMFEKVLAVNSTNPLARFHLGLLQLQGGDPALALETWEPVLADEPDVAVQYHAALALLALDRPQEAREYFQLAAKVMQPDHPLYVQLMEFLNQLGE